jgi:hypothetical protein
MLAEQENKVIGMIYEAALNPVLWQDVLTEIVDFTGSTTAIFTATDQLSPNYDFVFTHNIPPESMRLIRMSTSKDWICGSCTLLDGKSIRRYCT